MDNLKAIADLVSLIYAEVIPEDVYEDEQKLFEWVRDRLQAALDAMKGDTTDDTDTAGAGEGGENDVLLSNTVRMLLEAQHAEFNTLLSNMTRSGKMTPHRANGLRHQFKVGRPMKEAYGALPALIGYMQAAKEQFSNTDGDGGFGRQSGTQTGSGGGGDIKPPAGFMKVMQARAAKQKRN